MANNKITPIQKTSVSKETFDFLFKNIMNGTWKVGEKIPSENELRNSLMVSRHTIRSAVANLNMLGILESRQGDGNYVKATGIGLYIDFLIPYLMINESNAHQIIEFREAIEVTAARYAAIRATEEDLQSIKQKLDLCNENKHNLDIYPVYDLDFHCEIAKASKNDMLYQSMNVIKQYCFKAISNYFNENLAEEGADYHLSIYSALLAHDPDAAEHYTYEHMHNISTKLA